jgi:hypothetical protein
MKTTITQEMISKIDEGRKEVEECKQRRRKEELNKIE